MLGMEVFKSITIPRRKHLGHGIDKGIQKILGMHVVAKYLIF